MSLIKKMQLGKTEIEIYDDFVPKDIEEKRQNLIHMYDEVNSIAQNLPKEITKKWFLTENQIKKMKQSGEYNFI